MSAEEVDWKRKLKALGIRRTRGAGPKRAVDPRKRDTGRSGEELAARYLAEQGLALLDRNVRFRDGELDLVAEDGPVLVFVEVRRRTSGRKGTAAESVTARKRARIVRAARRWLTRHPREAVRSLRFDVVAVEGDPPEVQWIRGAFDAV